MAIDIVMKIYTENKNIFKAYGIVAYFGLVYIYIIITFTSQPLSLR